MNAHRPLRYHIRDARGTLVAEAETWLGARSAVVHIALETHQDAAHFRVHPAADPLAARFIDEAAA